MVFVLPNFKRLFCVMMFLISLHCIVYADSDNGQENTVSGYVFVDDVFCPNASVTIGVHQTASDETGFYEINGLNAELYPISAYWDDPETQLLDTFPFKDQVTGFGEYNISLVSVAIVKIGGNFEYLSKKVDILEYRYKVYNAETNQVISINGHILEYGTPPDTLTFRFGLDENIILVPSNSPFYIRVESVGIADKLQSQTDIRGEAGHLMLERGEWLEYDLLAHCLREDDDLVFDLYNETLFCLLEVENRGFYTISERHDVQRIDGYLQEYNNSLGLKEYNDASYYLKQAYVELNDLNFRLSNILGEAYFSTYLLIFVVALTSYAFSDLFTNSGVLRGLVYPLFYGVSSVYLYFVYPGSKLLALESFIYAMIGSTVSIYGLVLILPGILKRFSLSGNLNLYGIISSVYSLGKQNLKKRKLRSAFTFSTLLIFTVSFVALTSLSSGYGLVSENPPFQRQSIKGIMLKMPDYTGQEQLELEKILYAISRTPEGWFKPVDVEVINWVQKQDNLINITLKAENQPCYIPKISFSDDNIPAIIEFPIYGILGLQLCNNSFLSEINKILTTGTPLVEENQCLVHEDLVRHTTLVLGDIIDMGYARLMVVGTFNDEISNIIDLDGKKILPQKQQIVGLKTGPPMIQVTSCSPEEVIITSLGRALEIPEVEISRINLHYAEDVDLDKTGKRLALSREYRFWINDGEEASLVYMGTKIEGRGLPLVVPWGIVVLNVVATIMGTMYERKKEIGILSSIGLNPAHISGIFITEASILGTLAGGLGYLLGLGLYPLMNALTNAPVISQKISAVWSIATISISLISVLIGSVIALRSSSVITPSQKIKWRAGQKAAIGQGIWNIEMPILVDEENIHRFIELMDTSLEKYRRKTEPPKLGYVSKIIGEGEYTHIFNHIEGGSRLSDSWSVNRLVTKKNEENGYTVTLLVKGNEDTATKVGSFIRKIIIEWNAEIGKN